MLSPLGLWNCPAHRGVEDGRLSDQDAFVDEAHMAATAEETAKALDTFDASVRCRQVTCLYHDANWWLERAIADPESLGETESMDGDFFL